LGDLIDDMDQARKKAGWALFEEVRKLRTELCELSTVVAELGQVLVAEHAKVLDLRPFPQSRVN
jgi:hypothetical protein